MSVREGDILPDFEESKSSLEHFDDGTLEWGFPPADLPSSASPFLHMRILCIAEDSCCNHLSCLLSWINISSSIPIKIKFSPLNTMFKLLMFWWEPCDPFSFLCVCTCVHTHPGRCKCTCVNGHVEARAYLWVLACIIPYLYFWGFSLNLEFSLNGWTGFCQGLVTLLSVSPELGLQAHAFAMSIGTELGSSCSQGKHFTDPSLPISAMWLW